MRTRQLITQKGPFRRSGLLLEKAMMSIYVKTVPDFDWTDEISELLIRPLTVTSSRKLLDVTGCPDCD
jgi:hypothetical protein